jgi:XTP/dITP diphosphohydrolase
MSTDSRSSVPAPKLLIASGNAGKAADFRRLLPPSVEVLTLADVSVVLPPETGTTFAENAVVKATAAADQSGLLAIADDSGLEVDALGGEPGIYSARYAGTPPSDARNREKLLTAMRDIPPARRTARFRCAVALARPATLIVTAEGTCDGTIAPAPAGEHGFGYDPIFRLPPPDGRTMAQLSPAEKNRLSHRARAYQAMLPDLLRALALTEPAAPPAGEGAHR